jgi:polyphenol oxidase
MPSKRPNPRPVPTLNPEAPTHPGSPPAPHWQWVPWPVPGVRAGHSLRGSGASGGPYTSFNLGDHVGDQKAHVQANRDLLTRTLGVRPVFLSQVHGTQVQALPCPDGTPADAVYTSTLGSACCIMVADCLPILLSDTQGRVVAAAHAGWRGLCGDQGLGVVETLMTQLRHQWPDAQWLAWLGPCIGPTAFEVGADVLQAFTASQASAQAHFRPIDQRPGKWWCDLAALARQRLAARGVDQVGGNDSSPAWCTHLQSDRYFSHRRDRVSGRMAAVIFLEEPSN